MKAFIDLFLFLKTVSKIFVVHHGLSEVRDTVFILSDGTDIQGQKGLQEFKGRSQRIRPTPSQHH